MTETQEEERSRYRKFLQEILETCEKHNLVISHEDSHGGFLVEPLTEDGMEWLNCAGYGKYKTDWKEKRQHAMTAPQEYDKELAQELAESEPLIEGQVSYAMNGLGEVMLRMDIPGGQTVVLTMDPASAWQVAEDLETFAAGLRSAVTKLADSWDENAPAEGGEESRN
jgi:hypothetical protein